MAEYTTERHIFDFMEMTVFIKITNLFGACLLSNTQASTPMMFGMYEQEPIGTLPIAKSSLDIGTGLIIFFLSFQ